MPNNIDKRIVEMEFDNAQFENGVKTSTDTLNAFKESLDFNGVAKSADNFSKNFDLSNVSENAQETASAIERMQTKIPSSVRTVGKSLFTFGKIGVAAVSGITAAIGGLALKGGITRAMNLKQADFMLQGLVKDEQAVEKIMKNVNASVDGTAYSLDQAALVASQFAATGMRGGEEMEGALKGVAGAAAVFGADYSRVGQIFTQVAGQGRLMGNDLLQLSSMGMNAAATLADYFKEVKGQAGTTEADIRDMVSKSKIDFNTFAAAMNWAFGEQAAKANETFTGALANMKSALSRIGEKFASPVIDALRDLFNAIRPLINAINDQMTPVFEAFDSTVKKLSKTAVGFLDSLGSKASIVSSDFKDLDSWWGNGAEALANYFNGVKDGSIEASTEFKNFVKDVSSGKKITEEDIKDLVSEGKINYETLRTALDEVDKKRPVFEKMITDNSKKGKNGIKALAEYFNGVNDGSIEASKSIKEYVKSLTDGNKVSEKQIKTLISQKKITQEVFGAAIGKDVWKSADKDLTVFGTTFRSIIWIAELFKAVLDTIKDAFTEVFDKPSTTLKDLAFRFQNFAMHLDISKTFLENFKTAFVGFLTLVKGAGVVFSSLFKIIKPLASGFISFIGILMSVAAQIGALITGLANIISESKIVNALTDGLAGIMEILVNSFLNAGRVIASFAGLFGQFASGISKVSKGIEISVNPIESFKSLMDSLFEKINSTVMKVIPSLSDAVAKLGDAFSHFGGETKDGLSSGFDKFMKTLSAGGMGAALVLLNKFVKAFECFSKGGLNVNANFFKPLSQCLGQLGQTLEVYQTTLKAKALKEIATAIIILAGAVWLLSTIDPKRLASALIGVEALLISLFGTISIFTKGVGGANMLKTIGNMIQIGTAMVGMATAVLILSGALKLLSTCSWSEIARGILAIASMCLILGKVSSSLNTSNKNLMKTSKALVVFGIAINVMAKAIKAMGSLSGEELAKGLLGVIVLIGSISVMLNKYNGNILKGSVSLTIFAVALNIMAEAVKTLGAIDSDELVNGLFSVSILLAAIGTFVGKGKFGGFKPSDAASILILAGALDALVFAVSKLGSMKGEELINGMFALVTIMTSIGVFAKQMGKSSKSFIGASVSMVIIAAAMQILTDSVKNLGKLSVEQLEKGLGGIAAGLLIIGVSMRLMPKSGEFLSQAAALTVVSLAIATLAESLVSMGGMSMQQIGKGMAGLAGGLAAMVLALVALEKMKGTSVDSAASIEVMSVAIATMAPALALLGAMPIENIAKSLGAVAGAFLIFGVAAKFIDGPLVINMLALSASIALIGVACLSVGAGLMMFSEGLQSLGSVSSSSFENLKLLISTLAEMIPSVFGMIAEGIVQMIQILAQNAAILAETGMVLILSLLTSIRNHIGEISLVASEIIAMFVYGLAAGIGLIVDAAFKLALAFINGIADSIRNNQEVIFSAVGNLVSAIIDFFLSALQILLDDLPVIGDDISKGLEKAKTKVDEKLNPKEGSKAGEGYSKGISEGVGKGTDKTKKSGEKHAKQAAAGAKNSKLMKSAGETVGGAYAPAVGKAATSAKTAGSKLLKNAASGAGKTSEITKSGEKGGKDYSKGIEKSDGDAKKAGKNVASEAKSGMDSVSGYSGLGTNAAKGFVSGASSKNSSAYSAGWSLASSYYNAIKKRLEEHSPSKATARLAKFAVLGFVNESKKNISMSEDAGSNIANAMLYGIKNETKKYANIHSLDFIPSNPVIKPVVDLSGVRQAAGQMNSMFTGSRALEATARINGGFANAAVSAAENREMLSKLASTIEKASISRPNKNEFNITVDGAENPEEFANRLVSQLKVRMRTQ